jgi:hypothetical protein
VGPGRTARRVGAQGAGRLPDPVAVEARPAGAARPAGRAAASNLLFSTVLLLIVLFAAGMCLMATAGGAFMNLAYQWGNTVPVRKVFYNLVVTAVAAAVADSSGHALHIKRDMTIPHTGRSTRGVPPPSAVAIS